MEKFELIRKEINNDSELLEALVNALTEEELTESLEWIVESFELKI